ncbi:MAG TPA: choice-of-anchor Q domain-containing protein [Verrucomicrobiae bacterium]|nr:choice-of-anchor Q domain-containing protein [Verrucomicrobiae bacterium]
MNCHIRPFILTLPGILFLFPAQAQIVTTNSDSGPGSLRQTLAEAAMGASITFAASLSGQTISVTNGLIGITKSVTIDASALTEGVILNGHGHNSLFHCGSQTTNTLIGLTLTGGRSALGGGAILNDSLLTLSNCTLTGNVANEGGAIFHFEPVTLNHCTIVSNYARFGGAIENDGFRGPLTLNNCTLAYNVATNEGGAILNFFTLNLSNCTVTGNQAAAGGGISNDAGGDLNLHNSIVAGNIASFEPQISGGISSATGVNITSGNPLLAPLGDYGGPTQTLPPLPGSPAIDPVGGDTTSVFATDQRGLPRVVNGVVDVGAVEVQPASVAPIQINGAEMLGNGRFQFSFSNLTGASFQVLATTNVELPTSHWLMIGPAIETPPGSGQFQFTDPQATNSAQRFYRVKSP